MGGQSIVGRPRYLDTDRRQMFPRQMFGNYRPVWVFHAFFHAGLGLGE